MPKRYTQEIFERKSREAHGDKYDHSEARYVNIRVDVTIICPVHGRFSQNPQAHWTGHGCPQCAQDAYWSSPRGREHMERLRSGEINRLSQAACHERYGAGSWLASKAGHAVVDAKKREPEYRARLSCINSSKQVQDRTKATCQRLYGCDSWMQTTEGRRHMSEVMRNGGVRKQIETKRRNGTLTRSKRAAETYRMLIEAFGSSDVLCEHVSAVYPHHCDFYIPSRDLYVESNICWTHGKHWFDANDADDMAELDRRLRRAETSGYHWNSILTWVGYDVAKRCDARRHGLRYVTFWKPDLSDVREWIDTGCPDRFDWQGPVSLELSMADVHRLEAGGLVSGQAADFVASLQGCANNRSSDVWSDEHIVASRPVMGVADLSAERIANVRKAM